MNDNSSAKLRIPPNSKESEMMVLGCMLTSINALNIGSDALDDGDFYYTEHKIIFLVLKAAYKNDKPVDLHLVCEELKRQDKLKSVGGAGYIATLAQYAGTSAHIEEYCHIVRSKSMLRSMVHAAQVVEKKALDEPEDVSTALDEAQQLFYQISQTMHSAAGKLLVDILGGVRAESQQPFLKELQTRQERYQQRGPEDPGITGLPTHFLDFDKMVNGLGRSNLLILAARPAMGKTAFALNVAENVCFKSRLPVGIFSLEMSADQLVHRLICSQSDVESDKIRTGALNGEEFQRVVTAVGSMQQHVMVIDDQPGLKITDLRARARRMRESHGIELLVVDYLQLLSGSGTARNLESRQSEISEISRMLKNLARELNIPILCLSQLSRRVEERPGHRPQMSDLRESGCLTGDTQIVDAITGQIHTIKALAERPIQEPIFVHAVDTAWKIRPHTMVKAFYSGQKQIWTLRTRTGRCIQASANHPFLKLEGWTSLEQLQVGMKIALPRQLTIEKPETTLTDSELILLAHLIGDGCILPKQPYHYTSADLQNVEYVCNAAKEIFGISPRIVKQKNWYHVYLPSPKALSRAVRHPITDWYQRLGLECVRSYAKQLPMVICSANEDQIALFLRHLWSTDGNISIKISKGRKPAAAIYYGTSSETLGRQVQFLLLRLGIQTTIVKSKSAKGYRLMYHIYVQGKNNQEKFLNRVGCVGERGKIIPQLLQFLTCIRANPNCDTVPVEIWKNYIELAKKRLGKTWREVSKEIQIAFCGSTLFKSGVSRERLMRIHNCLPDENLLALATSDIYWDEIVEITEAGVEDVYDATVEGVHNFVANGLVVHNSIEQDADVVMFLLRREYYDPMDKPGMGELIVGKNRHGGIGVVNLTFRKELGQFANFSPLSMERLANDGQSWS